MSFQNQSTAEAKLAHAPPKATRATGLVCLPGAPRRVPPTLQEKRASESRVFAIDKSSRRNEYPRMISNKFNRRKL